MKLKLIALASAAMIGLTAVAIPNEAEARWRRGGWWIPGAVVGGLALGAIASDAYRPYYWCENFRQLATSTRRSYVALIKRIETKFGNFPLSAMTDRRTRGV